MKAQQKEKKFQVKRLANVDYDEKIKESRTYLARSQAGLSVKERQASKVEEQRAGLSKKLDQILQDISAVPKEVAEYKDSKEKITKCKEKIKDLSDGKENKNLILEENASLIEKIDNFLESFNIEFFNEQKDFINEKQAELLDIVDRISLFEEKEQTINNKIQLLRDAPCGISLKNRCHFVIDARHALEDNKRVEIELNQMRLSHNTINKKIQKMNPDKVSKYIEKYYMVLNKKSSVKEKTASLELEIEKDKVKNLQIKNILEDLEKNQQIFSENKKAIENLEILVKEKDSVSKKKTILESELNTARKEILDLYKEVGSLEQKYAQLIQQKEDFLNLEDEFTTADLFLRCMHPNGISYDIIKKRLPLINTEISKILTNIVDFDIFFENDESKLDILIKHPKHDPRPIELGSGFYLTKR